MTKRLTSEEFFKRAHDVHGDEYDYSKTVFTGMRNRITLTCRHHGDFEQKAMSHVLGQRCRKCYLSDESIRMSGEQFFIRAKEKHGERFDYTKSVFTGLLEKIVITCRIHGDFTQTAKRHLLDAGCKKCANEKQSKMMIESNADRRMTTDEFIRRCVEIHGDEYEYSKTVFTGYKNKIIVTCKIHGDFEQMAGNHLRGCRCDSCAQKNRRVGSVSKQESAWLDSLHNDSILRQHVIKDGDSCMIVDGYDESTNTVYEFHGDFWHGNLNRYDRDRVNRVNGKTMAELYERTISREQRIRDMGYNLVVMWESDWAKIHKELSAG